MLVGGDLPWGVRLGRFWLVWTDLWTGLHGLDVTFGDRRLLSLGSRRWRSL
jgi:hypothetical protein